MTLLDTLYSYYGSLYAVILFVGIAIFVVALGAYVSHLGSKTYDSEIRTFILFCGMAVFILAIPLIYELLAWFIREFAPNVGEFGPYTPSLFWSVVGAVSFVVVFGITFSRWKSPKNLDPFFISLCTAVLIMAIPFLIAPFFGPES